MFTEWQRLTWVGKQMEVIIYWATTEIGGGACETGDRCVRRTTCQSARKQPLVQWLPMRPREVQVTSSVCSDRRAASQRKKYGREVDACSQLRQGFHTAGPMCPKGLKGQTALS